MRLLQISDCHLTNSSGDDSEIVKAKTKRKTAAFLRESSGVPQTTYLQEALDLAENYDALILTGDIADSPTQANLQLLSTMLEGHRYLYTFGNHDYYSYTSSCSSPEDRDRYLDEFLRFLPCDPVMDSLQVGGVNLVALDDSLAQFSEMQLAFLRAELAKGLPILLFLHLPIYSSSFVEKAYECWDSSMAVGTPIEVLAAHGETDPKMQATEATRRVLELIQKEPLIRGIFASHLHFEDEAIVLGKPQFISKPCYLGNVRGIEVR